MGGDNSPEHLFPAIIQAASQLGPDFSLLVLATKNVADTLYSKFSAILNLKENASIEFKVANQVISMDEMPLQAIKEKKDSTLMMGIHLLKDNTVDALVSCGNTGALTASSALYLPLFEGITRPALLVLIPTQTDPVAVLDVGALISYKTKDFIQLAFLGAAYQKAFHSIEQPKVALLNVGTEPNKGSRELQETYVYLQSFCENKNSCRQQAFINFVGNIEGRDLFTGQADVIVTEGFTGNILLKTVECLALFIFNQVEHLLNNSSSDINQVKFDILKNQFNYTTYPGAIIAGVERVVIKVHGNATETNLTLSLLLAADALKKEMIGAMKHFFHLKQGYDNDTTI